MKTDQEHLVQAIVQEPASLEPWLVYADWLLERGDVRGELMNLELAMESGHAAEEAKSRLRDLTADEEALLSPRLAAQSHFWRFEMRRGFIMSAELTGAADDPPTAEAVAALFADPHAVLLGAIDLRAARDRSLIAAALAAPRTALRQLSIKDLGPGAAQLEERLPGLVTLSLEVSYPGQRDTTWNGTVDDLAHASLRELVTSSEACPALATGRASLPALESLGWVLDVHAFDARSILFHPPARLARLQFDWNASSEVFDAAAVGRLAETPVARQVEELSLRVTPEIVGTLANRADAFPKLERLHLQIGLRQLSPDESRELRVLCESAFAGVDLDFAWAHDDEEIEPEPPELDEHSRGPDGKIDALGMFERGPRRR